MKPNVCRFLGGCTPFCAGCNADSNTGGFNTLLLLVTACASLLTCTSVRSWEQEQQHRLSISACPVGPWAVAGLESQ